MSVLSFFRSLARLIGGSPGRLMALALFPVLALAVAVPPAQAQSAMKGLLLPAAKAKPGAQMLVESDQLVYDYDNETVSAVGNVKIYYNGYTLEADKVSYIKSTGRLIAAGRVKLTDPSGAQIYSENIDITDDFGDGFVDSLRVETPDKTHFAADSAQRTGGEKTQLNNGVYTACEPCRDRPEKPPLWQVQAKKIIVDHKEHMIYFHQARMEFAGVPIAYVPYFATADPSVKRKSGFLAPTFFYSEPTGFGAGIPYFWAMAPNYDLTFSPVYYVNQGFLGDAEWRHRLATGSYMVRMAGIYQQDPEAFLIGSSGTFSQKDFRGGIRTTGEFAINRYWSYGWDGTMSTDRTFTRNYDVLNNDSVETISNIHLTGLRDRSYFDARAEYFQILADTPFVPGNPFAANNAYQQGRQAVVAPVVDHNYIFSNPVLGGELAVNSNITNLVRDLNDPFKVGTDPTVFYHGLGGTFTRASSSIEWQKEMILPLGQVFKTFASVRGDAFYLDPTQAPAALTSDATATRFMPAVGAEWRWPFLAVAGNTNHVVEPIAQIIARPDEMMAGELPNDDAQSLVFDDTILFDIDKFSGYDRIEGGTRLNAGLHYMGTFGDNVVVDALFGQSYLLAGENSFASPDLADVGAFSGLETDVSDYVGRVAFDVGPDMRFVARGRFDEQDFTINRGEVEATRTSGRLTASAAYLYLRENVEEGLLTPVSAVTASASLQIFENWRVFGDVAYDLTGAAIVRDGVGIAFDNECLSLSLGYSEARGTDIPSRKLAFRVVFRTLGEASVNTDVSELVTSN